MAEDSVDLIQSRVQGRLQAQLEASPNAIWALAVLACVVTLLATSFGNPAAAQQVDEEFTTEIVVEILDAFDQPVSGLEATWDQLTATTDDTGTARLAVSVEGCHKLNLIAPEGVWFIGATPTQTLQSNVPICVTGSETEPILYQDRTIPTSFSLIQGFTAEDQNGNVIDDVRILIAQNGQVDHDIQTGTDGRASAVLGPGCHEYTATHPEGWLAKFSGESPLVGTACINYEPFGEFANPKRMVFVDPGVEPAGIEWTVRYNQVSDPTPPDVTLEVFAADDVDQDEPVATAQNNGAGSAVFLGLPDFGCYQAVASAAEGYVFSDETAVMESTVCIQSAFPTSLLRTNVWRANPTTTASVQVSHPGVLLEVFAVENDEVGEQVLTQTINDQYDFELPLGCYEFRYTAPDGFLMIKSDITDTRVDRRCFDFRSPNYSFLVDMISDTETVGLPIRFTQPSFSPPEFSTEEEQLPGALIELFDADGSQFDLETFIDPELTPLTRVYNLFRVPAGCYDIRVTLPDQFVFADDNTTVQEQERCVTARDVVVGIPTYQSVFFNITTSPPAKGVAFSFNARGTTGTELVGLEVNDVLIESWTLSTTGEVYAVDVPLDAFTDNDPTAAANTIRLAFLNDAVDPVIGDRNVYVLAMNLDGTTYNPRDLKSNGAWNRTSCDKGFFNTNWLACNGWFKITSGTSTTTVPLDITARGTTGTERIEVEVNGKTGAVFTLTTTTSTRRFELDAGLFEGDPNNPSNVVRVKFINDANDPVGGDRNVIVSELELDRVTYDPRDLKTKGAWTGTSCDEGFFTTNFLACNGWFELGSAKVNTPTKGD